MQMGFINVCSPAECVKKRTLYRGVVKLKCGSGQTFVVSPISKVQIRTVHTLDTQTQNVWG